jgi:hypothetical protein
MLSSVQSSHSCFLSAHSFSKLSLFFKARFLLFSFQSAHSSFSKFFITLEWAVVYWLLQQLLIKLTRLIFTIRFFESIWLRRLHDYCYYSMSYLFSVTYMLLVCHILLVWHIFYFYIVCHIFLVCHVFCLVHSTALSRSSSNECAACFRDVAVRPPRLVGAGSRFAVTRAVCTERVRVWMR